MNRRWTALVVTGILALTSFVAASCSPDSQEVPGQSAQIGIPLGATPAGVSLERLDGEGGTVDLADAIGRTPVLLEFWATWCENCEALHPRMLDASEEFGDQVAFYAIAVGVNQSPRRILDHLAKHPVPFPTLWDERGAAVREFQAPNTSYIVVLDSDGRVTYTGTGAGQDIDAAIKTGL